MENQKINRLIYKTSYLITYIDLKLYRYIKLLRDTFFFQLVYIIVNYIVSCDTNSLI